MPHSPVTTDNVISKKENLGLRGLCITLIVLHNLAHNVIPFAENEAWFDPSKADFFINNVLGHPILGPISYLGWMGVPIFFFLSGYGLSEKYGKTMPSMFSFIKDHYLKLLLLACPFIIIGNLEVDEGKSLLQVLGQLTFLNQFFENNEIHPAAFWYLGVAFEFYILYALILRRIPAKWLCLISLAVSCSFYFYSDELVFLMNLHCIGWLLDFSLGMCAAQHPQWFRRIENVYCSIALLALLLFASVNEYVWYFSTTFAVLFFFSVKKHVKNKLLVFLGTISSFLYVCHPVIRDIWQHLKLDYMNGNLLYVFLSVCAYFLVCVLAAYLYGKLYKKVLALMHGAFSKK